MPLLAGEQPAQVGIRVLVPPVSVAGLEHVEASKEAERAPGQAVPDPEAQEGVGVGAEVAGDVDARGLGQIDGRHGHEEAEKMVTLFSAQMDLMKRTN